MLSLYEIYNKQCSYYTMYLVALLYIWRRYNSYNLKAKLTYYMHNNNWEIEN